MVSRNLEFQKNMSELQKKGMSLLAISKTIEINLFYVVLLNFYNILKNNK